MQGNSPFNSELMGARDVDPGRWRPTFYKCDIDVPVAAGQIESGSVTTDRPSFWLTRVTHQIVGPTGDPQTTGLFQDGQYSIEWKDELSVYTNGTPDSFVMPDAIFGSVRAGHDKLLAFPMYFASRNTHTFRIRNEVTRNLNPAAETFRVQIQLHGISDFGKAVTERAR